MIERFLPAEVTSLGGITSGTPSCTTFISVPTDTSRSVTVVTISPGMFGSSNLSV